MAEKVISDNIKKIVCDYTDALKKKYTIHSVYLYGSYAHGNADDDSDIDIAVVAENFDGDIFDNTLSLMKIRRGIDLRIEPRPFTVSDFIPENPLANEVMENGIRIV
jgi:predicted nucleotidyltransferase